MSRIWLDQFQTSAWSLDQCIESQDPNDKARSNITHPIHALRFCIIFGVDSQMKEIIKKDSQTSFYYCRKFGHDPDMVDFITDRSSCFKYCILIKKVRKLKKRFNYSEHTKHLPFLSILLLLIPLVPLVMSYFLKLLPEYGFDSIINYLFLSSSFIVSFLSFLSIHYLVCKGKRLDILTIIIGEIVNTGKLNYLRERVDVDKRMRKIDGSLRYKSEQGMKIGDEVPFRISNETINP